MWLKVSLKIIYFEGYEESLGREAVLVKTTNIFDLLTSASESIVMILKCSKW